MTLTGESQAAVTDLTALTLEYLLDPFRATDTTLRVISVLVDHIRLGDSYALKLANSIREIKSDIWIPDWQSIISGQCMGITQRSSRCGRLIPGDTHHDEAIFWLCPQHVWQAQGVWKQLERFFRSASILAEDKRNLVNVLAESNETESVYFMSDGRYLKIGMSINPEARLKSLKAQSKQGRQSTILPDDLDEQSLQIILTIPGGRSMEKKMHRVCDEFHHVGEWFHYNDYLVNHLRGFGIDLERRQLDDRSVGLQVV
jgi:hypothetical protein